METVFTVGSKINVKGFKEVHTIVGFVGGVGYMTEYTAVVNGREIKMESIYVPFRLATAI